jgi:hypothetical protein
MGIGFSMVENKKTTRTWRPWQGLSQSQLTAIGAALFFFKSPTDLTGSYFPPTWSPMREGIRVLQGQLSIPRPCYHVSLTNFNPEMKSKEVAIKDQMEFIEKAISEKTELENVINSVPALDKRKTVEDVALSHVRCLNERTPCPRTKSRRVTLRETERQLRRTRLKYLQEANLKLAQANEEKMKFLLRIWCPKYGPEQAMVMMNKRIRESGMEEYLCVVAKSTMYT